MIKFSHTSNFRTFLMTTHFSLIFFFYSSCVTSLWLADLLMWAWLKSKRRTPWVKKLKIMTLTYSYRSVLPMSGFLWHKRSADKSKSLTAHWVKKLGSHCEKMLTQQLKLHVMWSTTENKLSFLIYLRFGLCFFITSL